MVIYGKKLNNNLELIKFSNLKEYSYNIIYYINIFLSSCCNLK
jgi:hypothetical protein